MEKMNSKKVGKVIGVALVVFLLAMVMPSCVVSARDDPIDLYSTKLNGVEKHTEVRPGEAVTVTVSYSLNTHVATREDKSNVVVGFEHEVKICLLGETEWDTVTFDGWYHFKKIFGINAPTKPGTYYIYMTRVGDCTSCEAAKLIYENGLGLQEIADFDVIASESDERDQGAIEVTHVSLNFVDLEDWFNVEPGELLEARVCYDYLYPWHLQKHEYRVVVGYEDTAIFCIDEEIRREYPDNTGDGSDCTIFTIKAPVEPGIYSIYKTYTKGLTCSEAKEHYESNPDARELIDHFEVKADIPDKPDEDDKWESIHVSAGTIDTFPYGRVPYSVRFEQWQNNLRMEISTSTAGIQGVQNGKLCISVDENVFVEYETGDAYGSVRKDEFFELASVSTSKTPKALAGFISNFIPYSGLFTSTIDLGFAIYKDTHPGFKIDEDSDPKEIIDDKPHEYFTTNNFTNERDVITIPWVLMNHTEVMTIRVDCPEMVFPSEGIHTVVFCVIANVYGWNVRHIIALPIETISYTDNDAEEKKEKKEC